MDPQSSHHPVHSGSGGGVVRGDVHRGLGFNWKGLVALSVVYLFIALVFILSGIGNADSGSINVPMVIGVIMILSGPVILPAMGLIFMGIRLWLNGRMLDRGQIPISNSRVAQLPPVVQAGAVVVGAAVGAKAVYDGLNDVKKIITKGK